MDGAWGVMKKEENTQWDAPKLMERQLQAGNPADPGWGGDTVTTPGLARGHCSAPGWAGLARAASLALINDGSGPAEPFRP